MDNILFTSIISANAFLVFLLWIRPLRKFRERGCDAYYFLLCVEEFKKHKKIPIILPRYFLLDAQEQWYPPGFVIFLSLFPKQFLDKFYWLIAPTIECVNLLVLSIFTYAVTHNPFITGLISLFYIITPTLAAENYTLTSRPLASLFFNLMMISIFLYITGAWFWLIPGIILGALVLLTHKLTTQQLIFTLPLLALIYLDYRFLLILGAIIIITIICSKGFYLKILKAHLDILKFWNRNWSNLAAHQVHNSPVYGKGNKANMTPKFHQKGLKGWWKHTITIVAHNPMAVFVLCAYSILIPLSKEANPLVSFFYWWVILSYGLILFATYIPFLRFLGEGYKYIKLSVLPVAYLGGYLLGANNIPWGIKLSIIFPIILSLIALFRILKSIEIPIAGRGTGIIDDSLRNIFRFLQSPQSKELDKIMCIPIHLCDVLAYHCRRKVLWGTHNYGFVNVEPLFPVLKEPIEYFVEKYNLSAILIDTCYVKPAEIGLSPQKLIFRSGDLELYTLR